jgi:hypothetical protein
MNVQDNLRAGDMSLQDFAERALQVNGDQALRLQRFNNALAARMQRAVKQHVDVR